MRAAKIALAMIIAVMLTGCSSDRGSGDWHIGPFVDCLHGRVCFVKPPAHDIRLGYEKHVLCFDDVTVIQSGSTYLFINVSLRTAAIGMTLLSSSAVFAFKFRRRNRVISADAAP